MREILFRGYTGRNWQYGYLIDKETIRNFDQNELPISTYRVIKETIGQYTGLTDKNGTKIFEGDIILSQEFRNKPFSKNYKSKRLIGVVEYYDRKLNNGNQIYESGYRVRFINDNEKSFYNCGAWSDFYDCEVIGNIFDNGELLNED
jgi:uncharacterized phage protein (TIGR01671 family)